MWNIFIIDEKEYIELFVGLFHSASPDGQPNKYGNKLFHAYINGVLKLHLFF